MDDRDLVMHVTICACSRAELIGRITVAVSDYLAANRHPDGVAPPVLAEAIVAHLDGPRGLLISEDGERLA